MRFMPARVVYTLRARDEDQSAVLVGKLTKNFKDFWASPFVRPADKPIANVSRASQAEISAAASPGVRMEQSAQILPPAGQVPPGARH